MYNYRWRLLQLIRFYIAADTIGNVHSPQIYELLTYILDRSRMYYDFAQIEFLRDAAQKSKETIEYIDYGAGSSISSKKRKSIRSIVKSSVSSPQQCQILYRLWEFIKPTISLELGSSVGISTAYLAKANSRGKLYSLEGDPLLSKLARVNLKALKIQNVSVITGPFATTLPAILDQIDHVDLIFMDGNHAYDPTMKYYQWIKPKISPSSVLVIDDLYWSRDMLRAWNRIISLEEVTYSVNLFEFGMVFFDPAYKQKKHLKIVDRIYKPWK